MSKQVDVGPEGQKIALQKLQRKTFLRNEFLKQRTDPFQHAIGEGGSVFDSAFLRYQAMQVSAYDYFKPSGRNILIGIGLLVVPMFGFGYLVHTSRTRIENSYRRGEVAYKDRTHKFA